MINKNFALSILLATSLFSSIQTKEANLPKIKPYFPAVAKAFDIAEGKTEAVLLHEFFDSLSALAETDPRPASKEMGKITKNIAAIIKAPKNYTQEQKEKALEAFFAWIDSIETKDQIVSFNDKKALEKTADILVNHSWSLIGQQLNAIFMLQRLTIEGLFACFGNKESVALTKLRAANELIKRAHNYSVKEVTDALITLEKNLPVLMLEITQNIEKIDKTTFSMGRDFKEYQECLAYMPQPVAPTQVPAQA